MSVFEMRRYVEAPRGLVWDVISDVELFGEVAPNLKGARKIEGEGEGMRRVCHDEKGGSWSETCVLWEEDHRYSMEVDTAAGYPYPLKEMRGTWGVEGVPGGSIITMRYDYRFKYGPLGSLVDRLFAQRLFGPVCEELLDNWERVIQERLRGTGHERTPRSAGGGG